MTDYRRKLLNFMLYGYGGLMLLLIAMSTGASLLNSNVLFQDGFWVIALDVVIALADTFAFAIASAVIIYGIYMDGVKSMKTVYAAFLSITVFHYVAVLCVGWLLYPGDLPSTVEEWLLMLIESLFLYILIDCLRLFVVGFVFSRKLAKCEEERCEYNRKARILGEEQQNKRSLAFPFNKFISLHNPIQIGVLTISVVYWVVFFIQYVYYAVMNMRINKFWEYIGFQCIELGFYLIMACICYCVAMYILVKFDEIMPKNE